MLVFEKGSMKIRLRDPDTDFWIEHNFNLVEENKGLKLVETTSACGYDAAFDTCDLKGSICINSTCGGC